MIERRKFVTGAIALGAVASAKAAPSVKVEITVRKDEDLYQVVRVVNSLSPEVTYWASPEEVQSWIDSGIVVTIERAF